MSPASQTTPAGPPLAAAVIGGGSFGTALAHLLAGNGRAVRLWVRRAEQADELNAAHTNRRYTGETRLHPRLAATADLGAAVRGTPLVLLVVPSRSFREVARAVGDLTTGEQIIVHATKGLELGSHQRMSQILREETPTLKLGALAGPNLSAELLAGHPAGALIASRFDEVCQAAQALFAGSRLRLYAGRDVVGTEVGGSFKNIIALAAGVVDGLALGDNTKSLLMTRGLSEMARFGVALGADVFTFGGLAGIGDLIATCGSPLSRNNQVGRRLAAGATLEQALAQVGHVAEGVPTTKAVWEQAQRLGLDLPIVRAVHGLLYEGWTVAAALEALMAIPVGRELAALRYR